MEFLSNLKHSMILSLLQGVRCAHGGGGQGAWLARRGWAGVSCPPLLRQSPSLCSLQLLSCAAGVLVDLLTKASPTTPAHQRSSREQFSPAAPQLLQLSQMSRSRSQQEVELGTGTCPVGLAQPPGLSPPLGLALQAFSPRSFCCVPSSPSGMGEAGAVVEH